VTSQCPLVAQSGYPDLLNQCPLFGVKRTLAGLASMSASDPKRVVFDVLSVCEHYSLTIQVLEFDSYLFAMRAMALTASRFWLADLV
jgi:hypothetical protein